MIFVNFSVPLMLPFLLFANVYRSAASPGSGEELTEEGISRGINERSGHGKYDVLHEVLQLGAYWLQ